MFICPLCEHVQERGNVCDICGKTVSSAIAMPLPIPPIPGLETGRIGDVDLSNHPAALEKQPASFESLSLEEMTKQLFADSNMMSEDPVPNVRCRACGNVQRGNAVSCDKCGSRLPRIFSSQNDSTDEDSRRITCHQCGSLVIPVNGLCPACSSKFSTDI